MIANVEKNSRVQGLYLSLLQPLQVSKHDLGLFPLLLSLTECIQWHAVFGLNECKAEETAPHRMEIYRLITPSGWHLK